MKNAKYIAGLITILGTAWLNAQINPGTNNIVSGTNSSVAGGDNNKITSLNGIIGSGGRNTNIAYFGTIGGGYRNQAETDFATIPGGRSAKTRSFGQMAYASGEFSEFGDAQLGVYVLRGTTVGLNLGGLFLDGSGANENIKIPSRGSFLLDIDIVSRADSSANGWFGNFFHYRIAVENQSGSLVWATLDSSSKTTHNSSVTVSIGTYQNQFLIYGYGEANQELHWVATVRATELVKP